MAWAKWIEGSSAPPATCEAEVTLQLHDHTEVVVTCGQEPHEDNLHVARQVVLQSGPGSAEQKLAAGQKAVVLFYWEQQ